MVAAMTTVLEDDEAMALPETPGRRRSAMNSNHLEDLVVSPRVPSIRVGTAESTHRPTSALLSAALGEPQDKNQFAAEALTATCDHETLAHARRKQSSNSTQRPSQAPPNQQRNLLAVPGQPEHISVAYAYVLDAEAGRLANGRGRMYTRSPWIQICFLIQTHPALKYAVYLASVVLSLLIFGENIDSSARTWTVWVELLCILVFVADTCLKAAYMGAKKYCSKKWHRYQILLELMFIFDWVLFVGGGITPRFSRPLRPFILLLRNRGLRRIFEVLLLAAPTLAWLFTCAAGFMAFSAVISVVALMDDYHEPLSQFQQENPSLIGSFDNVAEAMIRLFVLFTTENYPEIIEPSFQRNKWSFLFFFVYIFAAFFVNSLILALIVSVYFKHQEKQVRGEKKKSWKGLVQAFLALDHDGTGSVSIDQWGQLYHCLKPMASPGEILFTFQLLDKDKTGSLDCIDFLDLSEILKLKMQPYVEVEDGARFPALQRLACKALPVLESMSLVCTVVNFLVACIIWRGMPRHVERAMQAVNLIFCTFFFIEVATRLTAVGHHRFARRKLNLLDCALVCPAVLLLALAVGGVEPKTFAAAGNLAVTLRILWTTRAARVVLTLLRRVLPVMLTLFLYMLINLYFFAIVGMELFHKEQAAPPSEAYFAPFSCGTGFGSFECAFFMLFQVFTTSNWHEIMNSTIELTSTWAAIYFVSLFLCILVLLDLLVAVTIEAFLKAREGMTDVDPDDLQSALVHVPVPEEDTGDEAVAVPDETSLIEPQRTSWGSVTQITQLKALDLFRARARRAALADLAWKRTLSCVLLAQKQERHAVYRVTKSRGPWRQEIGSEEAGLDALDAMDDADVSKLSKIAGKGLSELYRTKSMRRESLKAEIGRKREAHGKLSKQQRTLCRISPILKLYSENTLVHNAEEQHVSPELNSEATRRLSVATEAGGDKSDSLRSRRLSPMFSRSSLRPDPEAAEEPAEDRAPALWALDETPLSVDTDESDDDHEDEDRNHPSPPGSPRKSLFAASGWTKVRRAFSSSVAPTDAESDQSNQEQRVASWA
eukprot:m.342774 g.342774  ORF g.342774 m.342774 type:complete len:1055 (-) comp19847_c0_seq1:33-3197(-)